MQLGQNPSLRALADLGRFWVNRYTGDPAASPAMSNIPPKAEVKSEHLRFAIGRRGLMALPEP